MAIYKSNSAFRRPSRSFACWRPGSQWAAGRSVLQWSRWVQALVPICNNSTGEVLGTYVLYLYLTFTGLSIRPLAQIPKAEQTERRSPSPAQESPFIPVSVAGKSPGVFSSHRGAYRSKSSKQKNQANSYPPSPRTSYVRIQSKMPIFTKY